jgi:hypothetical protein
MNTSAKSIINHENDMLLHVIIKVQVSTGKNARNNRSKYIIRASSKIKSGTSTNETCLLWKFGRFFCHIYNRVTCSVDSITRFLPGIKKHVGVNWSSQLITAHRMHFDCASASAPSRCAPIYVHWVGCRGIQRTWQEKACHCCTQRPTIRQTHVKLRGRPKIPPFWEKKNINILKREIR